MVENCDNCGACCRFFYLIPPKEISNDLCRYFILHGLTPQPDGRWIIPLQCKWLTEDGRCRCYEARPELCKAAPVGDAECLRARKIMGIREREG